jgi:hypothetical protein
MNDARAALAICEDIVNDPSVNDYAKTYAQAALDRGLAGEALDVQMNYVASNAPEEYKRRIAEWQGVDASRGFALGYCQVCGSRDDSDAYHGADETASGLVCVTCYDNYGGPDKCDDCGSVTYEGDSMISGPREGDFLCNACLNAL